MGHTEVLEVQKAQWGQREGVFIQQEACQGIGKELEASRSLRLGRGKPYGEPAGPILEVGSFGRHPEDQVASDGRCGTGAKTR